MWMQLEIIMLSQSKSEIDNLLAYLLSLFSHAQLFVTLWTVTHQAPLSLAFFKQEYWSGLPCLLQWIFPKQGSNPYLLCLLHWRWVLYPMSHLKSPTNTIWHPLHVESKIYVESKIWQKSTGWFQIGKGVRQGCILSPYLFNLYAEYLMINAGEGVEKREPSYTVGGKANYYGEQCGDSLKNWK